MNRAVGRNFHVVHPTAARDSIALKGRFSLRDLPCGLSLHWTDSIDQHDLITRLEQRPCVNMVLFLRGRARTKLGDKVLDVGSPTRATGALISYADADLFTRQGIKGQHVRKMSIGIPRDWFDPGGILGSEGLSALTAPLANHGHSVTWTLSPRLQSMVERILAPSNDEPGLLDGALSDLALSGRALDTLAQAFADLAEGDLGARDTLAPSGDRRLNRLRAYLEAHLFEPLTLPELARETAMSVSTLQRVFREAMGVSVVDYIRRRRLDIVREELIRDRISVTEAAFRAGYGGSANFATAFKRQFGHTPSESRRGVL